MTLFDLRPIGEVSSAVQLQFDVTLGLIDDWMRERALRQRLDARHNKLKYYVRAWDILRRFYREPFDRSDPTWGVWAEFYNAWPKSLPTRGGKSVTLEQLLGGLCEQIKTTNVADLRAAREPEKKGNNKWLKSEN